VIEQIQVGSRILVRMDDWMFNREGI